MKKTCLSQIKKRQSIIDLIPNLIGGHFVSQCQKISPIWAILMMYDVTFFKWIARNSIISSSEFPGHSSTNSSLDDANSFRRWYLRLKSCWSFSGPKKIAYRSHGMKENITRNPCYWGVNPCFSMIDINWHMFFYCPILSFKPTSLTIFGPKGYLCYQHFALPWNGTRDGTLK